MADRWYYLQIMGGWPGIAWIGINFRKVSLACLSTHKSTYSEDTFEWFQVHLLFW